MCLLCIGQWRSCAIFIVVCQWLSVPRNTCLQIFICCEEVTCFIVLANLSHWSAMRFSRFKLFSPVAINVCYQNFEKWKLIILFLKCWGRRMSPRFKAFKIIVDISHGNKYSEHIKFWVPFCIFPQNTVFIDVFKFWCSEASVYCGYWERTIRL